MVFNKSKYIFTLLLFGCFAAAPFGPAESAPRSCTNGVRALIQVDLDAYWKDQHQQVSLEERATRNEDLMSHFIDALGNRIDTGMGIKPRLLQLQNARIQMDLPGLTD